MGIGEMGIGEIGIGESGIKHFRRRVHIGLHIYLLGGIFCLPWHRHSGTRNIGFTSHLMDETAIKVK
jgi:hypothetical protein